MMNQAYCLARRQFLNRTANGIGAVAAATLLDPTLLAATAQRLPADRGRLGQPHFGAKAKRVIFLFQAGGPSHIDLFDHKPRLQDEHGQAVPASVLGTQRVTEMTRKTSKQCFGTPFPFSKHGQSGQWFSDRLPHMASTADMWCFIKSVHSEPINHDPAVTFMQTGQQQAGRPSFGAWMDYGLGSDCEDLPAYVVMTGGTPQQPVLSRYWHSGFLPAKYQGVQFQSTMETDQRTIRRIVYDPGRSLWRRRHPRRSKRNVWVFPGVGGIQDKCFANHVFRRQGRGSRRPTAWQASHTSSPRLAGATFRIGCRTLSTDSAQSSR